MCPVITAFTAHHHRPHRYPDPSDVVVQRFHTFGPARGGHRQQQPAENQEAVGSAVMGLEGHEWLKFVMKRSTLLVVEGRGAQGRCQATAV